MSGKTKLDYAKEVLARVEVVDGCWRWTGYTLPNGYGQIGRNNLVHRVVWELLVRPLTPGLNLDHQCHNRDLGCNLSTRCPHRRCVNPEHLEEVTVSTNAMRGRGFGLVNDSKEFCAHGHPFTDENTYYRRDRYGRNCKTCRAQANLRISHADGERIAWQQRELRRTGVWPKRDTWPGYTPGYQPRLVTQAAS